MDKNNIEGQDFYKLLGLERDCKEKEIKLAYRKLAKIYHPDLNQHRIEEASEMFQRLQTAYETLMDANDRKWYDEHFDEDGETSTSDMIDLQSYMYNSSFSTYDDNNEKNYYKVYGEVYRTLVEEESKFCVKKKGGKKKRKRKFPSFGTSKTPLNEVKNFYDYWMKKFKTQKLFYWEDEFNIKDAKNRKHRKAMLEENEKIRKIKRNEFNRLVSRFTKFVRSKDQRWGEYKKKKLEKELEKNKKEELLREIMDLENEKPKVKEIVISIDDEEEEEEEGEIDDELENFFSDKEKPKKKDRKTDHRNIYKGSTRKRNQKKRRKSKMDTSFPENDESEFDEDEEEVRGKIVKEASDLYKEEIIQREKIKDRFSIDEDDKGPEKKKLSKNERSKIRRKRRMEKKRKKDERKRKQKKKDEIFLDEIGSRNGNSKKKGSKKKFVCKTCKRSFNSHHQLRKHLEEKNH